jgi:cation:H+ antiporter
MDLTGNSLWMNLGAFALAAVLVWGAGTRITAYADELAERYDLSRAMLGLFMLSVISSLPEIATSVTASIDKNSALALGNLLGSIVLQVTLLAVADLFVDKRALTAVVPNPLVLLQGNLSIIMLALVTIAITVGDIELFGAGAWSWGLIGAACFVAFKLASAGKHRQPWVVNPEDPLAEEATAEDERALPRKHCNDSRARLFGKLLLAMATILCAGAALVYIVEALGEQTGMGQSYAGMALLPIAMSLPDISVIFAAVRAGLYTMAISGVLGGAFVNIALIGVVDVIDSSGLVLDEAGAFPALAALLGIVTISLFMAGLAERADRTRLRMGTDSMLVLITYFVGMFLLFQLRGGEG